MMKKYYVQLKKGRSDTLLNAISKNLKIDEATAKRTIIQGSVWFENKRLKNPSQIIKEESLVVFFPEFPIEEFALDKNDIIYEDDYLTVINKRPGVNSNQSPFSDIDSLPYGVQKYYDEKKIDYKVNVINRLDKPTSGLVFFAKNKEIEIFLHKLFKERNIRKLYLAVTPKFDLTKTTYFIKDEVEWRGKEKEAVTYIKFLKENDGKFYFIVYPLTGRTHQIRKHFLKYLTPIIGDALYGEYSKSDRLELLCFYYKFKHPATGKTLEIEYLPKEYSCK